MFRIAILLVAVLHPVAIAQERDASLEIENAIKDYTEAIRFDPKDAMAYIMRGSAYQRKGDLNAAIKDYTKAIRLDPKNANTYVIRGYVLAAESDFDGAIVDYTEAIRLDLKDTTAYLNRGYALHVKDDIDGAIKDFSETIRLAPKDAMAYVMRGAALQYKGNCDAAIEDYNKAIRLDPKDAVAYRNRGSALHKKNELDAAIKDYTESIRLDPKDVYSLSCLALLYATCPNEIYRDGKKAVELATTACELSDWKTWNNVDTLAAAYAESGEWENAIKYQHKAIEMAPNEKDKVGGRRRLELYKNKQPFPDAPEALEEVAKH